MGTKKGQVRKTARRAYEPKKMPYSQFPNKIGAQNFAKTIRNFGGKASIQKRTVKKSKRGLKTYWVVRGQKR